MVIKFKTKEDRDIVLKRIEKVKNVKLALNIETADRDYGFLAALESKIERSAGNTPNASLRERYDVYSVACSSGQFDTLKELEKWHEIVSILSEVADILNTNVNLIISDKLEPLKKSSSIKEASSFRSFL